MDSLPRIALVRSQDPRVLANGVNAHTRTLLEGLRSLGVPVIADVNPAADALRRGWLFAYRAAARLGHLGPKHRAMWDARVRAALVASAARRYRNLLLSAQVVHAQDYLAAVAVRRALGVGCPPVVLAHHANGLPVPEMASRYGLDPSSPALSWARQAQEEAYTTASAVVAVSPWAAQVLAQELGLSAPRLHVVPNGVPIPPPPDPPVALRPPRVVAVGQLVPRKGMDVLLAALALLAREGLVVEAVVAGDGPQLQVLRRLAQEESPTAQPLAQLPGAVAHVGELLRQARVFALPSRMDNLPMALLEAMANGVPVVATRVGGVPEAVGEGPEAAGTLVPPGDAPALAHALRPYLVDPAWAQEVGLRARRRAEERFGAARMAQGWLGVYRSLVAPGKADQAIP